MALRPGARLPMEKNEAYVARAAEEMIARHDLLVPYFNGEPRLRKPPLSYWLVIAADRLGGGDGRITESEARAPSGLGALLLALSAWGVAGAMFGRRTALVAGLLVAGCGGVTDYGNSARPDMLYAGLCGLGTWSWSAASRRAALSGRARHSAACTGPRLWSLAGWVAMGLAMLTKGPQLPLMLALGIAAGLFAAGRKRQIRPTLSPLLGPLVMLLVSGVWFVLVLRAQPQAAGVWWSQLASRAEVSPDAGGDGGMFGLRLPDLTYPVSLAQLLLPWSVFYVLSLLYPWLGPRPRRPQAVILWWTLLLPLLLLAFTHRYFYMLPVVPVAAALAAAAAVHLVNRAVARGQVLSWKLILAGHAVALAVVAVVLSRRHVPPSFAQLGTLTIVAAAVYLLWLFLPRKRPQPPSLPSLAALACLGVVLFGTCGREALLWRNDRARLKAFLQEVAVIVPGNDTIAGWRDRWALATYYLQRNVPVLNQQDDLARLAAPDGLWLLVMPDERPPLPAASRQRLSSRSAQLWWLPPGGAKSLSP